MATPGWLHTAGSILGHLSTIDWLVRIVAGFASASWAVSMMPGGWHPPQYWAVGGLSFSAGLLFVSLASVSIQKAWKAWHPTSFRLEEHGGQEATVTLFIDSGVDKFRPTGQLLDGKGVPLLPPYDLNWRESPGSYSYDRTKTISEGEYRVLGLALAIDHSSGTAIDFVGSGEQIFLRRHLQYISRSVDLEPVRLRVTIRSDSGLAIEREYLISWSGESGLFAIEQFG